MKVPAWSADMNCRCSHFAACRPSWPRRVGMRLDDWGQWSLADRAYARGVGGVGRSVMAEGAVARRSSSLMPLLAAAVVGLFVTDFFPVVGTATGIAAAVAALIVFFRPSAPSWLAWLLVGFAAGVVLLYALALFNTFTSSPANGSGSSAAIPRR